MRIPIHNVLAVEEGPRFVLNKTSVQIRDAEPLPTGVDGKAFYWDVNGDLWYCTRETEDSPLVPQYLHSKDESREITRYLEGLS